MWFCICLLLGQFFYGQTQTIELKIEEGKILGRTGLTEGLQLKYYAFQGIPYAEPPKRFELAIPKKRWSGILNCTSDIAECVQTSGGAVGSEDCLFLGVYTRKLSGKSPVLVWIHGGGFEVGNGSYKTNGPDYFLDEDLVFVSIQYRLGIFGFMSTGDLVCPGNLGLKDQNLALKWVQRNVGYFGGDPDNVSIMGQSAGSASVAMHLNSPKSKGLFKKAIMNSGVSISSWSLNRRARQTAFAVGFTLGIFTNNSTILVNQLKKVNYQRLQDHSYFVSYGMALDNLLAGIPYGPVKEVEHDSAFFTGESEVMLSTGNFTKVPVLAGFTSNETVALSSAMVSVPFRLYFLKFDLNSMNLVPADLTTSTSNKTLAARAIKEKYFGKYLNTGFFAPFQVLIKFFNVDLFVRPIDKFVIDVSKYVNDVYYYMFSYVGDMRRMGQQYEGVSHAEELNYFSKRNIEYSPNDQLMRKRAVRMWSNFCKFSKPIPKSDPLLQNATWLPASSRQPPFLMNIDSTLERVNNPYQDYLDFYTKLYKNYGDGTYGTY